MKALLRLLAILIALGLAAGGYVFWQVSALDQAVLNSDSETVEYEVARGSNANAVLRDWQSKGWLQASPWWRVWLKLHPREADIKAGTYRIARGDSLRSVLYRMWAGDVIHYSVTFVEGWNIRDLRAVLAKARKLKQTVPVMTDAELMAALGKPGLHPEGQFFPSTYSYTETMSDRDVLAEAMRVMDTVLAQEWEKRQPQLPYATPYEALIMASIVEKETGHASDRHDIAGVFVRRLDKNMRLQTDPTVIYGLGARFDGNLRKVDLQTDTPYNSYTRAGLPPSPICMPGREAIQASLNPAAGDALYFVARGDGTTVFSATLEQHNAAVREFQLKRRGRGR
ncbi:endolytic transglycosylase MltG [Permianibacter sp. IMCC34836]|uniref:endolytic transglycosylase MltG n=1 Tax=Permianibacter fluminis TaxID=2738515 RepID=UPI00155771F3|nr:endolytic transglycosylase MltG [Permianibacter fluminis]NQD38909.1 endolytic transglycosylase MltG [Permianibacter fluminis]